jgi:hypothetical protein
MNIPIIPPLNKDDGGARRRIKCQPYDSKFVPSENLKNLYKNN